MTEVNKQNSKIAPRCPWRHFYSCTFSLTFLHSFFNNWTTITIILPPNFLLSENSLTETFLIFHKVSHSFDSVGDAPQGEKTFHSFQCIFSTGRRFTWSFEQSYWVYYGVFSHYFCLQPMILQRSPSPMSLPNRPLQAISHRKRIESTVRFESKRYGFLSCFPMGPNKWWQDSFFGIQTILQIVTNKDRFFVFKNASRTGPSKTELSKCSSLVSPTIIPIGIHPKRNCPPSPMPGLWHNKGIPSWP